MNYSIQITNPSDDFPLIEHKRDFDVWGTLKGEIREDMALEVKLLDEKGTCVRQVSSYRKGDRRVFTDYAGLVSYREELDPGKEKLKDFGFPELLVSEEKDPYASLNNACIKCFFDDEKFKAVIVSGSDVSHGRIMDTLMDYRDAKGMPYQKLEKGNYTIRVNLLFADGETAASCEKRIRIDARKEAAIVRFNPSSHRKRMTKWCKEEGFAIINDTLPGYLEPYLGSWYYHMGLLPYYRSNDIAVYEDALVHMFVYLCDPASTSYETELAYLQSKGRVSDPSRFKAYHYDIGEALLGKGRSYEAKGEIKEFRDEDLWLYRVDLLKGKNPENVFDLREDNLEDVFYDPSQI